MDIEYGASGQFSGNHRKCPKASWPHGHSYRVLVVVTGDLNPVDGSIRGSENLGIEVDRLLDTLAFQDLEQALPGSSTGIVGIATAIAGSLQPLFSKMTEVVVEDLASHEVGRVRRQPRGL
jgi:6-pyruvoyl-tetrahydropterin synthase